MSLVHHSFTRHFIQSSTSLSSKSPSFSRTRVALLSILLYQNPRHSLTMIANTANTVISTISFTRGLRARAPSSSVGTSAEVRMLLLLTERWQNDCIRSLAEGMGTHSLENQLVKIWDRGE
jgi:hypothetical protein